VFCKQYLRLDVGGVGTVKEMGYGRHHYFLYLEGNKEACDAT